MSMSSLSRWMIAYGALLLGWDAVMAFSPAMAAAVGRPALFAAWSTGPLMLAAGLAANQQRRSLRLAGTYVGLLLPVSLTTLFGWHAADLWRVSSPLPGVVASTGLALISVIFLIVMLRARPRVGDIARRGYAITISAAKPKPHQSPAQPQAGVQPPSRRSQAG